ncbi:TetR/AcrR family transcriptional regulator [Streptomyces specialis]|uniref:TetR/AcrR family transcriptional regulator n=1 Tax=Streptomyces specialis TaxID=498367 RepID=UPI00073EBB88|nr:TetR/AcrR family transcriptional regulator [Streptomyces specialis]
MARVSQEHLEARRRQIIQGAARCFSRDGFHGTSMQDIFRETGLSAGAVYRYFPGKEAIIAALANEVLTAVRGAFDDALAGPRPAWPDEIIAEALRRVDDVLLFPPALVIQVWSETFRDPRLAGILHGALIGMADAWAKVVASYQENGLMSADVPPAHVARVLLACAQGFLVQRALLGPLEVQVMSDGLRGLMSMGLRRPPEEEPGADAS